MIPRLRPLRNEKGFTLTEAMVVVSIIGLMVGLSYSGYSSWIRRERVRSAAYELAATLKQARFQAIEKHTSHTVEPDNSTGTYYLLIDPPPYFGETPDDNNTVKFVNLSESHPGVELSEVQAVSFGVKGTPRYPSVAEENNKTIFKNEKGFNCSVQVMRMGEVDVVCQDPSGVEVVDE